MNASAPRDRVALITGSGRRRLGQHVAEALVRRGDAVIVHYYTSAAEAEATAGAFRAAGARAIAARADLTRESEVEKLVSRSLAEFGRLDYLVNCAAIWERKSLEAVTAADVHRAYAVNALGTFLCCQKAGLAMAQQQSGGAIVNFGDWAVARPYRDYAAYFASKGAVEAITRTMAVELAARNPRVRVNCVLPGPAMLPADLPAAERQEAIAGTLLQREGSPENIVQAVLHFLDNDFVTGACLSVDGGRTIFS